MKNWVSSCLKNEMWILTEMKALKSCKSCEQTKSICGALSIGFSWTICTLTNWIARGPISCPLCLRVSTVCKAYSLLYVDTLLKLIRRSYRFSMLFHMSGNLNVDRWYRIVLMVNYYKHFSRAATESCMEWHHRSLPYRQSLLFPFTLLLNHIDNYLNHRHPP